MDDSTFIGTIVAAFIGILIWAALSRLVFRVSEIDNVKKELEFMRTYLRVIAEKLAPEELAAVREELASKKKNKSDTSKSQG